MRRYFHEASQLIIEVYDSAVYVIQSGQVRARVAQENSIAPFGTNDTYAEFYGGQHLAHVRITRRHYPEDPKRRAVGTEILEIWRDPTKDRMRGYRRLP